MLHIVVFLSAMLLATGSPARAADPSTQPVAYALAGGRGVDVGNSTRVAAPIASDGSLLLDERAFVGRSLVRTGVHTRLLAQIDGDLTVTDGPVDFGNQAHVRGSVAASGSIIVGQASRVDGDVVSTDDDVRIVRLAEVDGNVFVAGEFRGERDVRVGAPGTTVQVRGDVVIRDRGEYLAEILHEGPITFFGVGAAVLHAGERQVPPGSLVTPPLPAWRLDPIRLPDVKPGTVDVLVQVGEHAALAPGAYGSLVLEQEAVLALVAGGYRFADVDTRPDSRVEITLGATDALTIDVAGDVAFGRRFRMVPPRGDPTAGARIVVRAGDTLRGEQDAVLAGTLIARKNVILGKHTTLAGAAWSAGLVQVGRDSTVSWLPSAVAN